MRAALSLLLVVVLLGACDTADEPETTGLPAGSFEAEVEGYVSRSLAGEAVFDNLRGFEGPFFYLRMGVFGPGRPGERDVQIVDIVDDEAGPPAPGVYTLPVIEGAERVTAGDLENETYSDSDVDGSSFKPTGGTVEIYASDSTYVEGTFSFTAYDIVTTGPGTSERAEVSVSGAFHAVRGDTGIIVN